MVSILPCKRGGFLDASPPACARISGAYERHSSPNISCLISVPSVWRGEILAPPRDNSYPKVGGRSCLLRAPLYIQNTPLSTEGAGAVCRDQVILQCLTLGAHW